VPPTLPLSHEEIATVAEAAVRADSYDRDPRGQCVNWSSHAYRWLTDKEWRNGLQDIGTLVADKHIAKAVSATLPEPGPFCVFGEHTYLMVGEKILDLSIPMFFSNYENLSEQVLGRREPFFFGTRDELRKLVAVAVENTRDFAREHGKEWGFNERQMAGDIDCRTTEESKPYERLYKEAGAYERGYKMANAEDRKYMVERMGGDPVHGASVVMHSVPTKCFERCWGSKTMLKSMPPEKTLQELHQDFGPDVMVRNRTYQRGLDKVIRAQELYESGGKPAGMQV